MGSGVFHWGFLKGFDFQALGAAGLVGCFLGGLERLVRWYYLGNSWVGL